ncbi:MAG: hypothetical protein AAFR38_10320 [Planctomycetota bacterium]
MTEPNARPQSGRRWIFMIVGLLLLNVSVCAITVVSALRHPAQVEPDYYERAINWDRDRALEAASSEARPAEERED